jgi:hypothetical protein
MAHSNGEEGRRYNEQHQTDKVVETETLQVVEQQWITKVFQITFFIAKSDSFPFDFIRTDLFVHRGVRRSFQFPKFWSDNIQECQIDQSSTNIQVADNFSQRCVSDNRSTDHKKFHIRANGRE